MSDRWSSSYRSVIRVISILLADGAVLLSALAVPDAWFEVAVVAMAASLVSHYGRRVPSWLEACQITAAALIGALCSLVLQHVVGSTDHRLTPGLLLAWACLPVAIIVARQAVRSLLAGFDLLDLRTLVASDPARAEDVAKALASEASLGYRHVGSIGLGALATLGVRAAMARTGAEFLVIAPGGTDDPMLRHINTELALQGVPFAVALTHSVGAPVACAQSHYFMNCDLMLVACGNRLNHLSARLGKAVFDVVLAGAMLVLLAPVLGVLMLLVRADGGPAFYAHERVGANGRRFGCLKFRTMVTDADAVLARVLADDPAAAAEWQASRKLARDPRITRIGRLLRRTSLDELPQLLNVLRGEMSLVGPRPIVAAEIAQYGAAIDLYYRIKPGITGLWQVSGRSFTSYSQRVEMDTWYVKNWALRHDIAILARTVVAVLSRRGAC